MRLSKLKLAGFKTFVDPTTVLTPGNLVGVVGPNGCGKSNIIDAVRWVLGETRASALRGESMQDVIFNGSTTRKPVSRASVELVFDNAEGRAAGQWSRYGEISVKRVLDRSGESTYYINNVHVRRKDVIDLFLGTGLGPRAYAIIEQGMISRIIEARPEEIRGFLEEAAGVTKYRERRKETEGRLRDARDNLARLDDIRNGSPPDWAAQYVAQSFPLARDPFELAGNAEQEGYLEMRNAGAATWRPGEVYLGTTEPRDGASAIAASDWIANNRAATIDREVPPGATGRFVFSVRAPNALGDYPQFFNLVREGVAWFSDGGQGGPPDNQLQIRVTTTSVTTEMPDAGPPPVDAGISGPDASMPPPDAGVGTDAGGVMRPTVTKGGCGCSTTADPRAAWLPLLALFALARRRRAR